MGSGFIGVTSRTTFFGPPKVGLIRGLSRTGLSRASSSHTQCRNGQSAIWNWWLEFEACGAASAPKPIGQAGDTLPMTRQRHPQVADHIFVFFVPRLWWIPFGSSGESRNRLMIAGEGPAQVITQTMNFLGSLGWGCSRSHQPRRRRFSSEQPWPRLDPTDRVLVRSQRGPMASIPFHTPPVSAASRFDPQCFKVLFLRRLWCQFSSATCRCGQPLDLRHPRGSGSPRVSAGELCSTDLQGSRSKGVRQHPCPRHGPISSAKSRPVVWKWSDGLPLFHGAQLAVDTTS